MSLEDDLERSGRNLFALPGWQVATSDQLRRRRRRGRALGAVTVAVGVLLVGLSVADLGAGTQPTPVDVVDTVDPGTRTIESGSGPTTIEAADGERISELVAAMPTSSSDPVADRVLEELLDDELVARSLAEAGVDGDRDARAALLSDAGLIVETSIRSEALELARTATVVDANRLTSALIAVSPDGEIVALAGPTGVVNRQPGGAYLPFVMAAALESGVPSEEEIAAPAEVAVADDFVVGNFGGQELGTLTLAEALAASANTPWATLIADGRVSTDDIAAMADRFGLPRPPEWSQQPAPLATPFGIFDVTPTALAGAYATFATGGVPPDLHTIRRILDGDGHLVYDAANRPTQTAQVVDREVVVEVREAMEQVVCCGSGTEAKLTTDVPQFGKTGTTSVSTHAWFAGSTPGLTTVVWAGNVEPDEVPPGLTGGGAPARIWKTFMEGAVRDTDPQEFS